ncbi:MAG: hypothetical protein ACK4MF_11640 [Hyphomicrobiaceae bacterium]
MAEFLIKREDGHFLRTTPETLAALPTTELKPVAGWGILRLEHGPTGGIVVIDDEMPGLKVWFEGAAIHAGLQRAIVDGLAERLKAASAQDVYVIAIG